MNINGRPIGPDHPPYIVAEIGASHSGSLDQALRLLDAARESGADAAKIQTYTPDTITIDCDRPEFMIKDGPWSGRTLYDLYRDAHTPWEWHETLFEHAENIGITLFSTPFDHSAVEFLESLGCPAYKIASFEIVDLKLIEKAASTGKPVIISTGMASETEVVEAFEAAKGNWWLDGHRQVALLHCVSGYPTPASEANLRRLRMLSDICPIVGLSDHSLDEAVAIAAVALGASIIEKHIMLSGGEDIAFALDPVEFEIMADGARVAWKAIQPSKPESESASRLCRRSLYAVEDIAAGEFLTESNVRSIRPSNGLAPKHLDSILGKRAASDIKRGTPLSFDLVHG